MTKIKDVDALLGHLEQGVTGPEIADEIGEDDEFTAALAAYFDSKKDVAADVVFKRAAKAFEKLAIEKIVERKFKQMEKENES